MQDCITEFCTRNESPITFMLLNVFIFVSRDSDGVTCGLKNSHLVSCSFPVVPQQVTYNITLLVENSLGRESEHYTFNITDTGEYVSSEVFF